MLHDDISVPSTGARPLQYDACIAVTCIHAQFQSPQPGQGLCNVADLSRSKQVQATFQSPQSGQCLCNQQYLRYSVRRDSSISVPSTGARPLQLQLMYKCERSWRISVPSTGARPLQSYALTTLLTRSGNFSPLNRGKASAMSDVHCNGCVLALNISVPSTGARPLQ